VKGDGKIAVGSNGRERRIIVAAEAPSSHEDLDQKIEKPALERICSLDSIYPPKAGYGRRRAALSALRLPGAKYTRWRELLR